MVFEDTNENLIDNQLEAKAERQENAKVKQQGPTSEQLENQ